MPGLPETKTLDLETDGDWLTVWFNAPENRNALTAERAEELSELCRALSSGSRIRGVTFRGRGGIFCAGGDLKAFATVFQGGGNREAVIGLSRGAGELFDAIDQLPQFTVMAVEGAAMAGGFGMVCCGDMVIAEAGSRFSLSEVKLGLSPAQIAPFVVRRIGMAAARRLMLTAATLDAGDAVRIGLVDEFHNSPEDMDRDLAAVRGKVLACAPQAVAATKSLLREIDGMERHRQIALAAENFADRLLGAEGREGVASFMGRRKPAWAQASQTPGDSGQ